MVYIVMKPGSIILAHKHEKMAEALYAMEGDFIN
jgi:quercetin dioxygenase-like cupin family protein